jgi:hypothetical protein
MHMPFWSFHLNQGYKNLKYYHCCAGKIFYPRSIWTLLPCIGIYVVSDLIVGFCCKNDSWRNTLRPISAVFAQPVYGHLFNKSRFLLLLFPVMMVYRWKEQVGARPYRNIFQLNSPITWKDYTPPITGKFEKKSDIFIISVGHSLFFAVPNRQIQ